MEKKLIVATKNQGKLKEFKRILEPFGFIVSSMDEAGFTAEIEETGTTFAENAVIKSKAVWNATKCYTLADDSGLCIDALDGAPGVYSARYMGEDTPFSVKMKGILSAMSTHCDDDRAARFTCALSFTTPEGETKVFEDSCEGRIGYQPLGDNGFGYDPIFMIGDKSFAEITNEQKDEISHRGKAVRAFCDYLKSF